MKNLVPPYSYRRTLRGYAVGRQWRPESFQAQYTVYGRTMADARRAAQILTRNLNARQQRNKIKVLPKQRAS